MSKWNDLAFRASTTQVLKQLPQPIAQLCIAYNIPIKFAPFAATRTQNLRGRVRWFSPARTMIYRKKKLQGSIRRSNKRFPDLWKKLNTFLIEKQSLVSNFKNCKDQRRNLTQFLQVKTCNFEIKNIALMRGVDNDFCWYIF